MINPKFVSKMDLKRHSERTKNIAFPESLVVPPSLENNNDISNIDFGENETHIDYVNTNLKKDDI
jgi:hypothetical protein